jgi:hypothetical protein
MHIRIAMSHAPSLVGVITLLALTGCPDNGPEPSVTETGDGTTTGGVDSTGADTLPPTTTPPATTTTGEDTSTGTPPVTCPEGPLPTPTLVAPDNAALDVPIQAELCWQEVDDGSGSPIRYRVLLDGIDLTDGGKLGEPGTEGSCLGPLDFNYEQDYEWQVQAFAPGCEGSDSALSDVWGFRTIADGITETVFEDPFDDDLGWELGGDAIDGNWMRGNPVPALDSGEPSQPDNCAGGDWCYFTGQNPLGSPSTADVDGGSTTMTSPPFDLSPYAAVSVSLERFFYKSTFPESGTGLLVELLIPNDESPSGYQALVLEQLDSEAQASGANAWMPREYVACGIQMLPGTRLRLTATDLGNGILESAIDNVEVRGHMGTSVCDGGEGAICDPNAETPCSDDLLCCAQGTFNHGVYRCAEGVPSVTYPNPGGGMGTFNGPLGCDAPDIFVVESALDPYEEDIFVEADSCLLYEGCVAAPGWRRVLRFDTFTPNAGSRDLTMGVPSNHPDLFHFSECHNHYHFDGYANYELVDDSGAAVALGHKQAFCLIDLNNWSGWSNWNYDCGNQGISVGMGDVYSSYLDCQFIDITDVTPGDYTLRVELNQPLPETAIPPLVERRYDNNISETPVTVIGG